MERRLSFVKYFNGSDVDNYELAQRAMLDTPVHEDAFGTVWVLNSQRIIEMADGECALDIRYLPSFEKQ